MTLALAGVAVGLVTASAVAQALRHLIWGVSVNDPVTFAAAALIVVAIAALAVVVPAVRVARMNPIRALRTP
jgi:putative ABC transport system permease protein